MSIIKEEGEYRYNILFKGSEHKKEQSSPAVATEGGRTLLEERSTTLHARSVTADGHRIDKNRIDGGNDYLVLYMRAADLSEKQDGKVVDLKKEKGKELEVARYIMDPIVFYGFDRIKNI